MGDDVRFWVAIAAALVVKIVLSSTMTIGRVLASAASGIFAAWIFTGPILSWFGLDAVLYRDPTAAVLALTGEQIVRRVMRYADRPGEVADDLKKWRGGK